MKVGIEAKDKDIYSIIRILNSNLEKEIKLDELLVQLLVKNISSSDILFLVLEKLERDGFVKGQKNLLSVEKEIESEESKKILSETLNKIQRYRKLFVTPLEIGKFYQCPRRLFLEKIAMAKQYKEERGKTWDGETVHLAINLLIKNFLKKDLEELLSESASIAINKYKDRITINEEKLKDFLLKFYELLKEENFSNIFTEKTFQSLKTGLVGTPDIVGIKENEIIPIDIKLGWLARRGVKEEHLLQNVGEAILIENFFRKKVKSCYLIYFESGSLVKIDIDEVMKRKFLNYKRQVERICSSSIVPERGRMRNLRRRVCLGCHVKPSCENIEDLRRIIY